MGQESLDLSLCPAQKKKSTVLEAGDLTHYGN